MRLVKPHSVTTGILTKAFLEEATEITACCKLIEESIATTVYNHSVRGNARSRQADSNVACIRACAWMGARWPNHGFLRNMAANDQHLNNYHHIPDGIYHSTITKQGQHGRSAKT